MESDPVRQGAKHLASQRLEHAMDYRGKVIIVTGASSGIGYVTARAFARRGGTVIGVARRKERLEELILECASDSPTSTYLCGDLGERAFAEQVITETLERFGRVDVLVNNAAISKHKHVLHLTAEEADYVMRVNFMSSVWTTLAVLPSMLVAGGGTIVNVSSFASKVTPPREGMYSASKAAMNAFSEGLWNDLEGTGIHVAIVNPGAIDTEIWLKEDEPPAFDGKKFPPEIVTDAIFAAVEKRIYEQTVPWANPSLVSARLLRLVAPAVLRMGMAKMEPVPAELIENARKKARSQGRSA
jgi:short-subunit dehydrogenase